MSGIIIIGSQWGDEGKGKAVDVFSSQAHFVVRYQGGSNAGHTLYIKGQKRILHLIPSGIFHKNTTCIISTGVVLDIETLVTEINDIKKTGDYLKNPSKLLISDSATVLLDYHKILDQARENSSNSVKIGTTGKGIGPAYEDRASRKALLFGDLFTDIKTLKIKLERSLKEKNFLIKKLYKQPPISLTKTLNKILTLRKILKPYRYADTSHLIYKALKSNKKVLFEGSQGSLLDLLHGTYPYVTSSSTLAGSALVGVGMGSGLIKKVIAITKAYTTRVGEGPFPTECNKKDNQFLQQKGNEFGSTTGRIRRCGWLDLPALKYAVRINGITHLALMKLDVLSELKQIPICISYKLNKKIISDYPIHSDKLNKCKPIYKTLKGWNKNISDVKKLKDLPKEAQNYIAFIQKELNIPVDIISVGPHREETIWKKNLF